MGNFPKLITASAAPVEIPTSGSASHTVLRAPKASSDAGVETFGVESEPDRIYLHLDHLTSDEHIQSADVYIGVPNGEDPTGFEDQFAGRIGLFGLVKASRRSSTTEGTGLSAILDVTDLVKGLPLDGDGEEHEIAVAIRVVGEPTEAPLRVGRISLYAE